MVESSVSIRPHLQTRMDNETLLETPASDATLIDFDGDGKDELLVLSPFHGDTVLIYREKMVNMSLTMNIRRKSNFFMQSGVGKSRENR